MKPARIKPFLILSHGLESGPDAAKVKALATATEPLGFKNARPDYRDIDKGRNPKRIDDRIARLKEYAPPNSTVVLAGSSLGAFTSVFASLELNCVGMFLMALPITIKGYSKPLAGARVPTAIVHGLEDEICPVDDVLKFARTRGNAVTLVHDDHRLSKSVDFVAEQFRLFLTQYI